MPDTKHHAPHPMERLAPVVSEALDAVAAGPTFDRRDTVDKALLLTLWRLAENVAIVTQWQHALHEQIEEMQTQLEALMPADTTKMNQNYADAKSNVVQLAAAHGTSSTEAQAIADDAAQKFADLRDTAKAALPADSTTGTGGTVTLPGTAETPAVNPTLANPA